MLIHTKSRRTNILHACIKGNNVFMSSRNIICLSNFLVCFSACFIVTSADSPFDIIILCTSSLTFVISDANLEKSLFILVIVISLIDNRCHFISIFNFGLFSSNYSAPYYMISCLAVVLQQGMRCISNFRSS